MKIEIHEIRKKGNRYEIWITLPTYKREVYYCEHQDISGIEVWNFDELLGERIRELTSSSEEYANAISYIQSRLE